MSHDKRTIFITGATGNLGGMILSQAVEDYHDANLVALARGKSQIDAESRLCDTLKVYSPGIDFSSIRGRLKIVCGDITEQRLGLSESRYCRLAKKTTHIIHAAAATKFGSTLSEARRTNYTGTENIIRFAQRASRSGIYPKFAYISTAYVCGDREGEILENDAEYKAHFSNNYEQSKWEAEQLVRRMLPPVSLMIFRPSIIVGDSDTGRITTFNVLYPILKMIARGIIKVLPGRPDIGLDIIPVDYASRAILHIFLQGYMSIENTFNIVAGKDNMMTTGEIVRRAISFICRNNFKDKLATVPLSLKEPRWDPSPQSSDDNRISRLLDIYRPHLNLRRHFNYRNTQLALKHSAITMPVPRDYFDKILEYSFETDWGKTLRSAA